MMKMPIEQYENILLGIVDLLENGDVIEDFVDEPARATTLRIIHEIVAKQLDNTRDCKEVLRLLNGVQTTLKIGDDEQ